jgi:hypothetical protein
MLSVMKSWQLHENHRNTRECASDAGSQLSRVIRRALNLLRDLDTYAVIFAQSNVHLLRNEIENIYGFQ